MKWFLPLLSLPVLFGVCTSADRTSAAEEAVDYLRQVKPILARHCYSCHGVAQQKVKLRLDTAAAMLKGGSGGPALIAGKSEESLLYQAINGAEGLTAMPYKKPRLGDEQIAIIKKWIDEGARAPADEPPDDGKSRHWAFLAPERPSLLVVNHPQWPRNAIDHFILARLEKEGIVPSAEADRVTLIRRLSLDLLGLPPSIEEVDAFVKDESPNAYEKLVDRLLASPHYGERWGRHWLDLARYADSNGFNIDAAREIWKYRDWIIDALNADMPFDQFTIEQLAGDLLPEESVVRGPLSVAKEAKPQRTTGYGLRTDRLIATGFHRNTLINQEGGIDAEQFRVEAVVDRLNTTASVFLGLTLGCAQCHDHKFDRFTQKEYYQLFAFFNNCDEPTLELPTPEQAKERQRIRGEIAKLQRQIKQLDLATPERQTEWQQKLTVEARLLLSAEIRGILDLAENSRTNKQKQQLAAVYRKIDQMRHVAGAFAEPLGGVPGASLHLAGFRASAEKRMADLRKAEPDIITTMIVRERPASRETAIHIQGDFTRKGERVTVGVPAVMHPLSKSSTHPNRLDFAHWIVDPKNPLTARVMVNRLWQHYFGTGLVETSNDFGVQGTPPTHPELLDWLAVEIMEPSQVKSEIRNSKSEGNPKSEITNQKPVAWSLKHMHRLIVTSATYRQSSRHRPELAKVDPSNRLLARQNRLRLEAEIVRDVSLTASGLLNRKIGGPSVFPPQPDGVFKFTQIQKEWKPSTGADRFRRGMYTHFWRSAPHPALMVFDAPESTTTCTRRTRSNTPLQSLTLLNDQAFFEFAQALAGRALREGPKDVEGRVRFVFRLCLSRDPSAAELRRLVQLAGEQRAGFDADPEAAGALASGEFAKDLEPVSFATWTMLARVLLNLDEFITRE